MYAGSHNHHADDANDKVKGWGRLNGVGDGAVDGR